MYHCSEVVSAACQIRVLGIILVAAVLAFALKSRAVLLAGSLGAFLGYVVPEPRTYLLGTLEGCFMEGLADTARHVLVWGTIGAAAASGAVVALQALHRAGRLPKQFSVRTLLLVMAAVAVVAAFIRLAAN